MGQGKTAAATRLPGWLRFVLALWAIALLLLGLQGLEVGLFASMGG
jgi:hypothetical protein